MKSTVGSIRFHCRMYVVVRACDSVVAAKVGVHPAAKGTAWWSGAAGTWLAYNADTGIGCAVLSNTFPVNLHNDTVMTVLNAANRHIFGDAGADTAVKIQPT